MDETDSTSSALDYNNAIDGLLRIANTAISKTLDKGTPQAAVAPPGTLFGYPIKTIAIVLVLGVLAIWLGKKLFNS